jgi:hypothetical protein
MMKTAANGEMSAGIGQMNHSAEAGADFACHRLKSKVQM